MFARTFFLQGVHVFFRLRLGALICLFLVSLFGCDSSNDNFVFTNSSSNQGLTLQVAANPANLRGVYARFSPFVTQFRVTVFDFRNVRVAQQVVPRNGTAVFTNLPVGRYLILTEGLLTGGTVVGHFYRTITLNVSQTILTPGLVVSNTTPEPDIDATESAPPYFIFTTAPDSQVGGVSFAVTAQVFNGDGSPVTSAFNGVSLVSNGVAFASIPASQNTGTDGVVTFSGLTYPAEASGTATLVVDATGVNSATSGSIAVTMAPTTPVTPMGFLDLITQETADELGRADLTPDARFVAYSDSAAQLPADTNGTNDVYVFDRTNDTVERVSVDGSGTQGDGPSFDPAISSDGRFVAFSSEAGNLVPNDNNASTDVFVYDRTNDSIERVSVDSSEQAGNGSSFRASISGDGRYVAFTSRASNLVTGDTNARSDIFLRDRTAGTTVRISVDPNPGEGNGQGNGDSDGPVISTNGRFVAFTSEASNFVSGDTATGDVFVVDLMNSTIEKASLAGGGGNLTSGSVGNPAISSDGRFVAFGHGSGELVSGDTNGNVDIFVRDRQSNTTERVSLGSGGEEPDEHCGDLDISDDGRFVVFATRAGNLVTGDTNDSDDIFLRDRQNQSTTAVSVVPGQSIPVGGFEPRISGSGGAIALGTSGALVSSDTNGGRDLYVVSNPPPTP